MPRLRIIPVLLLKDDGLVKSIQFKNCKYIGDPINAVRIFNDLHADELVFLDTEASKQNRLISTELIAQIGEESNMPFAVGGGIKSLSDIQTVISAGAEKVVICTAAVQNPAFIRQAADAFGSSTISVCVDVKKKLFGGNKVFSLAGSKASGYSPVEFAQLMEANGAGELIIQSIDRDGTMEGYDVELIHAISAATTIPIVALGGAGTYDDLEKVYTNGFASGAASGSLFVYQGKNRGVLISYPQKEAIQKISELKR